MTESKQDTITVELPIAAHDEGYVKVDHIALATRERWREIAADPVGADTSPLTAHIAPAVVAWIERDEWEPLDLPEVGRTIKATLRDGAVETFKVGSVSDAPGWARIWKSDSGREARYIERTPDVNPLDRGPTDIIAWEYVDEPAESEPEATHTVTVSLQADLSGFADSLQAAVDAIREASK